MKRAFCLGPITLAGALLLSGCNGTSPAAAAEPTGTAEPTSAAEPTGGVTSTTLPTGPTTAQRLAQLEDEGKLPKLDRSESVAGPDTDGNGVRDDIDAYLRRRFSGVSAQQHAAALQMAKAMQSAMLSGGGSADASKAASRQIINAVNCLHDRFDGSEGANAPGAVGQEIEAITANTKGRLLAYLAYNKSRNGTASSLPDGDTCE